MKFVLEQCNTELISFDLWSEGLDGFVCTILKKLEKKRRLFSQGLEVIGRGLPDWLKSLVILRNRWMNIRAEERKAYQINACRGPWTRARQGMVICIPGGNPVDQTRLSEFYGGTYQYLKGIGIPEI